MHAAAPRRRSFSAAERYAIWERDQRCTFVGPDGRRCNETRFIEIDHAVPFALGGASDRTNGRLLCRLCGMPHNVHYAECLVMPNAS
jgi:5-methylcytosine-specific restriction endonuclease McrA